MESNVYFFRLETFSQLKELQFIDHLSFYLPKEVTGSVWLDLPSMSEIDYQMDEFNSVSQTLHFTKTIVIPSVSFVSDR